MRIVVLLAGLSGWLYLLQREEGSRYQNSSSLSRDGRQSAFTGIYLRAEGDGGGNEVFRVNLHGRQSAHAD